MVTAPEARWTGPPAARHYPAMPKKIAKKDLPSPDDVPAAKPLVETIAKRRTALAVARAAATTDGAVVKHEPRYRAARKKLKRAQRRLRVELIRAAAQTMKASAAES
jgi:hypothetical protein